MHIDDLSFLAKDLTQDETRQFLDTTAWDKAVQFFAIRCQFYMVQLAKTPDPQAATMLRAKIAELQSLMALKNQMVNQ